MLGAVAVLAQDRCGRTLPGDWTEAVLISGGDETPLARKWADGGVSVCFEERVYELRSGWRPGQPIVHCEIRLPDGAGLTGGHLHFRLQHAGISISVSHAGAKRSFIFLPPRSARMKRRMAQRPSKTGIPALNAPMPGVLTRLRVEEGDQVKTGEEIGVIEAMKMENSLRSPRDGRIQSIAVAQGDNLETNQMILRYE